MPPKRSDFNSQIEKKRYNRGIKRQAAALERKGKLPQAQRFVKPSGNGKGYSSKEAAIEKKFRPFAEELIERKRPSRSRSSGHREEAATEKKRPWRRRSSGHREEDQDTEEGIQILTASSAGFKGEGRMGSLGEAIPIQEPVRLEDITPPWSSLTPVYNEKTVEELFGPTADHYFRIPSDGFWDGKNGFRTLKKGCRVLWKSGSKGKNGGESTKVEFFSGMIHDWKDDDFCVIS